MTRAQLDTAVDLALAGQPGRAGTAQRLAWELSQMPHHRAAAIAAELGCIVESSAIDAAAWHLDNVKRATRAAVRDGMIRLLLKEIA